MKKIWKRIFALLLVCVLLPGFPRGILAEEETIKANSNPVIIIPGYKGSRLFDEGGEEAGSFDPAEKLHVRACENQQDFPASDSSSMAGREYGQDDLYKNVVDVLCSAFPQCPVYFFNYDWREGLEKGAENLEAEIERTLESSNSTEVDLVCHSMGGLLGAMVHEDEEEKIGKLISLGSPFEGIPELLQDCIYREDYSQGTSDLTPSEDYIEEIPMWKDSTSAFKWSEKSLSWDEYKKLIKKILGKKAQKKTLKVFKDRCEEDCYTKLLQDPGVYFAVGINHASIAAVKFQTAEVDGEKKQVIGDLKYDMQGDGRVPYQSLTMTDAMEELAADRIRTFNCNHRSIIAWGDEKEGVIGWIKEILETGSSSIPSDEPEPKGYIQIRVACPVDIAVSNGDEILYTDSELQSDNLLASYGRMDIIGKDREIKVLCLADGLYQLQLKAVGEGRMDYSIRFFDDQDELIEERIFKEVPLTEGMEIITGTDREGPIVLSIDKNGDGHEDSSWTAREGQIVREADEKDHECQPAEAVKEHVVKASCTSEGSYEKVIYCSECGAEISRKNKSTRIKDHEYQNGACINCGAADPSPVPTEQVTPVPTKEATPTPTEKVKPASTKEPTPAPTEEATPAPTLAPTAEPTEEPLKELTEVKLLVDHPVRGKAPGAVRSEDSNYMVRNYTWDPAASVLEGGKVYSLTIEVEASGDLTFAKNTVATVNGTEASVKALDAGRLQVSIKCSVPAEARSFKVRFADRDKWVKGSCLPLIINCDGPQEQFTCINIDNKVVKSDAYTVRTEISTGATQVELHAVFLETLEEGTHSINFAFKNRISESSSFIVYKNGTVKGVNTGDQNPILLWAALLGASLLVLGLLLYVYFKKRN